MSKVFLDSDPSIFEKNLLLPGFEAEDGGILGRKRDEDNYAFKSVKPTPGFCAKCRSVEGDKVFINVCHTYMIPSPDLLTDEELISILESDEAPNYKIPMSIGSLHVEVDKGGNLCSAYDIAINTNFFEKISINELFKTFFMTVAMEGLQEKYSIEFDMKQNNSYIILKNRKVLGTIQTHNIQQRAVKRTPKSLIEELPTPPSSLTSEKDVNSVPVQSLKDKRVINTKLVIEKFPAGADPQFLIATVYMDENEVGDVSLDVGEDRLVLRNEKKHSLLVDIFLPYNIDSEETLAFYTSLNKVLTVKLPVVRK